MDGPSITQLVDTFHARQPGISVTVREVDPTLEPYTMLRRGDIDVIISWLNVDDPDITSDRPSKSAHGSLPLRGATASPPARRSASRTWPTRRWL